MLKIQWRLQSSCANMARCGGRAAALCAAQRMPRLLRLSQGDLAQPCWSPGATAMVLHHMERLELHGIWRAETEVAVNGGASVRAACKQSIE